METAAKLARGGDRALNGLVMLLLLLALLYGGYALWDTWQLYDNAAVDQALLRYKPAAPAQDGSNPTLNDFALINPDVRAWLTLDGTHVDYPVVQGRDNVLYVNTDAEGNYSLSGSIFLDYRCAADFSDPYSLLYGHHMDGGMMFGDLAHFVEAEYFNAHSAGTLYLAQKTYTIEIFACLAVDAYDLMVFDPHEAGEEALLAYIREKAVQYRDIGAKAGDRIIGLTTCSDAATNARTAVYGRLKEIELTQQGGDTQTP